MINPSTQFLLSLFLLTALSCASSNIEKPSNRRNNPRSSKAAGPIDAISDADTRAQELRDELTIGREMAAKLCGTFGLWEKSERVESYVRIVGSNIARQVGRPEINFSFGVLATDEVNAFAAPGGYIFVTTGLLKHIRTESELAGVLAHEIAHINHKHMFKDVAPKREVSTNEIMMKILSKGKSEMAQAFSKAVNEGLKKLLESGLSPEKEFEADESAAQYIVAAGYDVQAFRNFLQRLGRELKSSNASVAKTHPSFEHRITKLDFSITQNGLSAPLNKNKEVALTNRFSAVFKGSEL